MNPQSTAAESDYDLLDALARGETEAIATLYTRHGARMVAFAARYVRNPGAAEDVVITLLGRWLERPPKVREAERMSAFLATTSTTPPSTGSAVNEPSKDSRRAPARPSSCHERR